MHRRRYKIEYEENDEILTDYINLDQEGIEFIVSEISGTAKIIEEFELENGKIIMSSQIVEIV